MKIAGQIQPCLWFDNRAEEAARFYVSIFENSKIGKIARFGDVGQEVHGGKAGTVMTVEFELNGQPFLALNGGPLFKFSEAVSFQVFCDTQKEIDFFWSALSKGGEESQCGWLKDKFGLSWQVVPSVLPQMMTDPDRKKSERVMGAFMEMKKLDLAKIQQAFDGELV